MSGLQCPLCFLYQLTKTLVQLYPISPQSDITCSTSAIKCFQADGGISDVVVIPEAAISQHMLTKPTPYLFNGD